jgi:primase-polymerase (primpol)-like protein
MSAPTSQHQEVRAALTVIVENIPLALREGKRFVGWRYEDRKGQPKPAKMPYSPDAPKGASSTAAADWTTFKDASAYVQVAGLDGIMRAFDAADGMVGIDFDNCRDPETGELTERVAEYVKRLDTYAEVSPSGTGVKLWAYGTLPPHGRKRGDVEMYCAFRFFTQTGHWLDWTPREVKYRPDAILAIHREVFGDAPDLTAAADDPERPVPALAIGDEDVLRLASGSAHNRERFRRLWSGDTSDYARDGNDGVSEADCALCELLAYYGGPDRERIERLWLRSGLGSREKVQRADYRKRTIDTALRGKTRYYGDNAQSATPAPIGSDGASGCTCEVCPHRAEETRLRRLLLDRDDLIEHQQGVIRKAHAEVKDLNRQKYAEWRLRRSKLKSVAADAGLALARLATSRAEYYGTDAPVITGKNLADELGVSEQTARTHAEAICNLPDSPIERVTAYRTDGQYGQLTTYRLAVRDQAELVERLAVAAEKIEEAPKTARPKPLQCQHHPNAPLDAVHKCRVCHEIVEHQAPMGESLTHSDGSDASVSVPVVIPVRISRIAGRPDTDDLADRRARAAQDIQLDRAVADSWKQPTPKPVNLGPIRMSDRRADLFEMDPDTPHTIAVDVGVGDDPPPTRRSPWRCRCGSFEGHAVLNGYQWRCDGCGNVGGLPPAKKGAER